jgi:DNA-binding MarR family transcriptional regulator
METILPKYNVFRVLGASKNGNYKITDVSKMMLALGANMAGIAKRLEKGDFLIRKSNPKDQRVRMLEITAKAKQILKSIQKEKDALIQFFSAGFSKEEKLYLLSKIKQLISNNFPICAQGF